ncbi:MAG: hypothetical protein V3V52_08735 [Candidatus Adiutricales bacterium]
MSKISVCLVIILTILCGSVAFGADKPELHTKTVLSVVNVVLDLYYTLHRGNADEFQSMFLEKQPVGLVEYWISNTKRYNLYDYQKMEFIELNILSKNPVKVKVVIRFSYGKESPPSDDLIILKKVGEQWKISHFGGLGLP